MKYIIGILLLVFTCHLCIAQDEGDSLSDEVYRLGYEKKHEEARAIIHKILESQPEGVYANFLNGFIYGDERDFKNAAIAYETTLTYLNRDIKELIEKERSVHDLKQLYNLKCSTLSNASSVDFHTRKFKAGYDKCEEALEFCPDDIFSLNNMAMAAGEMGDNDKAIELLKRIVELDSLNSAAFINLGYTLQSYDKYAESLEYFDRALILGPNEPLAYSNRSYSRLKLNDKRGAMKDINRSLELFPENSYAFKVRALIYLKKGRKKKACQDLNTALALGYTNQFGEEVNQLIEQRCK